MMKRIQDKLLFILILGTTLPMLTTETVTLSTAQDAQEKEILTNLDSVVEQKKNMIDQFFAQEKSHAEIVSHMPLAAQSVQSLISGLEQGQESATYQDVVSYITPLISTIAQQRKLQDIYILSPTGQVVYTLNASGEVGKELFALGLEQNNFSLSVQKAINNKQPASSLFQDYLSDQLRFSAFITAPILNGNEVQGVIAFQVTPSNLDYIVQDYTALETTGETVLARLADDKALFISPLRFNDNAANNVGVQLNQDSGKPIQEAVQGVSGQGPSVDYRNIDILASWRYLPDYSLGIVVKIDREEAFKSINQRKNIVYLIAVLISLPFLIFAYIISRRLTRPLIDIVESTNAITSGNLDQRIAVNSEDELGQLANSINEMSDHINRAFKEEESTRWLQHGVEQLSETMRGNQISTDLSDNIVAFVSNYLNAKVGSLYIVKETELELAGGFAFVPHFGNQVIAFGDGLVGQSAISKKHMVVHDLPEDYAAISSSLGEVTPHTLIIYPIVKEDAVIAVIELGWLTKEHPQCLTFLDAISESVGTALGVADSHNKLQVLLDQSQQQMEELQVREEELRAINEEVEQRSKQLAHSQKELERQSNELKSTNEALEHKTTSLEEQNAAVEAKNKEIEESKHQLETKAEQLEASSKYKSEFLANMSHELRTPLNSMLILSRILADNDEKNLDDDQVESAQVINNSGKQLLNLINDILDLSKIEAGKMEVNFEEFNFSGIVKELAGQFKPVAKEKGLELVTSTESDVLDFQSFDVQKTQQILKNLLSNALKFTDKGTVSITTKMAPDDHLFVNPTLNEVPVMSISVNDSGIGISKEKTKAIFEAFQQADGSTSRKYGGTGLGLTISRHLTDLIGGELSVHSDTGQGSTFTLHLPLRAAMQSKTAEEPMIASAGPVALSTETTAVAPAAPQVANEQLEASFTNDMPTLSSDGQQVIVIIEDDIGFSKVLNQLAKRSGFDCVCAHTGEKGLEYIEKYQPCGVILDLGLPDIEGSELLAQLKQSDTTKDIPVHIISGHNKSKELIEIGAEGYHQKPIAKQEISDLFSSFISSQSAGDNEKIIIFDDATANARLDLSFLNHTQVDTIAVHSYDELSHNLGNSCDPIKGIIIKAKNLSQEANDWLDHSYQFAQENDISIVLFVDNKPSSEQKDTLEKYNCHVILDGTHSNERLHDEVSLFLSQFNPSQSQESETSLVDSFPPIPVATPAPAPILSISEDESSEPGNSISVQGCNVLLVDDDLRNTFALSKVLKKQGMIVTLADNGQMALEKLYANDDIDIVLMDIMMPVMDGYEAMTQIRQNDKYSALPIIALTAKAMQEDRRKCVEAGASDYLTKPVDVDKLVAMMKVWLYQEATQS